MRKAIKNHRLSLTVVGALAVVALVTASFVVSPEADAAMMPLVKQINSYQYPGGPFCGYQRYFCDGSVVTSQFFESGSHRVTTWLNQCEEF